MISSIMAKLKICRKTMHFEVYTYYFFFHSKMIFLIFEFQPCISLSFDNWQNKSTSQEKEHFPFEKRILFAISSFTIVEKNHFRLDERLRKWPFSAKISLQLQGLIMWCFLVLGHCDKIHLRVEGVFCPVSISVPVHNCLKQFLEYCFGM